ncbi:MAG: serine/threonine protein kinase [Proteobacteria bacterium]|nr:serine/threonine protein kinase [Pseudomonadota bacterium]
MTSREKYRIIRKIDSGGMAEVFLGEAESIEGFKKRVAIKRVLPHLVENQKFLAMFLDEARLSLRFNHGNVVNTFDIGRSGNTYFVVMEYVDGTNLKRVMEVLRENNQRLPVELAVFIVAEACRGLAYAHDFHDQNGNPLEIVHRDVSPPNILLSKQGEIKIVDFGLAKATSQLETTDPGVVKGKFAYLSPEAAYAKIVDRRADLFACGIILFETLTGQRLFLGENDINTIELVRQASVPSISSINPDVPPNLEKIARKALAKKPEDRYQSCNELAEALVGFLFEHGRKVTSFDLQRVVEEVAAEDELKKVAQPSIIDQLIQEEMGRFSSLENDDGNSSNIGERHGKTGAAPLDPTGFQDPQISEGDGAPPRDQDSSSVWRESGRVSRESSPGGIRVPNPLLHIQESDSEAPSLAQMLEGEVRLSSVPPEREAQSRALLVAIIAATAIAVAGALAAYILGWIP